MCVSWSEDLLANRANRLIRMRNGVSPASCRSTGRTMCSCLRDAVLWLKLATGCSLRRAVPSCFCPLGSIAALFVVPHLLPMLLESLWAAAVLALEFAFGHPHLIMPACSTMRHWICHRGAKTCSRPLVKKVVSSALGPTVELWRTGHYLAQPFCGCPQELERPEQYFPSNGQISVCFNSRDLQTRAP